MVPSLSGQSKWRSLLALLVLAGILAGPGLARNEAGETIGHVLDLSGDWHVYQSDAGTDGQSRPLTKWQDLPAGGVLRITSPSADDYITIVDLQMKVFVERSCRLVHNCFQPIFLPKVSSELAGTDVFELALRRSWELLSGGTYERSMHRIRGSTPVLSEGVTQIRNGRIDVGEAMRAAVGGRYALLACGDDPGCGMDTNARGRLAFRWNPQRPAPVTAGNRPAGLYEIRSAEDSDQADSGSTLSVRILVCAPRSFPLTLAAFQATQSLTDKWGSAASPPTRDTFLRAYLAQLASAGTCTK
jgi:hypothetical protein